MTYAKIKNTTLELTKVLLEETGHLKTFNTTLATNLLEKKENLSHSYTQLIENFESGKITLTTSEQGALKEFTHTLQNAVQENYVVCHAAAIAGRNLIEEIVAQSPQTQKQCPRYGAKGKSYKGAGALSLTLDERL